VTSATPPSGSPDKTDPEPAPSLFDAVGGLPFFEALVDRFYEGIEGDPVLLPLYPQRDDLAGARRRLMLFLAQYWGGPTDYSAQRGHPRLRGRHLKFRIGEEARDHWLARMREAVVSLDPPADIGARLDAYFVVAAEAMRNED
jgi:hemoglobin